ncbi:hypothetical protein ABZT03_34680 [Streptomyces sp. NPDC005574]|uniref:hypothetical protein n=1 Tax=Streptomyces sp. NPDC005574 TaxID=3156891 RepID=UPI0033B4BBB4
MGMKDQFQEKSEQWQRQAKEKAEQGREQAPQRGRRRDEDAARMRPEHEREDEDRMSQDYDA